ncbi:TBC1 domain family member 2A [Durusdinium trenchii]|uniref:TBC1 domain family member 2A n=1 Tax=Durusdinium trenchii TaxID=1381693 RepID=A0ABP0P673_9DINO
MQEAPLQGSSSELCVGPRCLRSAAPGTYAKTWSNPSGAVLRCCVPGSLWAAERPFVWNSIDVGGKMAVIRLPSGALWVHSPVELDVHLRAQLAELGPVQHVVSPNFEHVKYAKQWKEAYPEATLWGSPGMIEKFPKIPYDRELDIASPAAWQGDIEICFADCERIPLVGTPFFNEVIFYHVPSETLITTDIFWSYPEAMPEGSKLWKFLMDKIYLPFYRRFMLKDEEPPKPLQRIWPDRDSSPDARGLGSWVVPGDVANGHEGGEEPSSILDVIEADVARTFPNDDKFQEGQKGVQQRRFEMGGPDHLRLVRYRAAAKRCAVLSDGRPGRCAAWNEDLLLQVLVELARQDMELGYCQSLNFIAANFLMVLHTPEMAVSAVRQLIMKLQTRQWYMEGMRQLRWGPRMHTEMLRERLPAVHQVLVQHQFDFLFVTSKWFLCLFAATLSDEVLRRVWDVLLVDGIEAVFRVSLSLFALHQKAILQVKSQDDLIHMMQVTVLGRQRKGEVGKTGEVGAKNATTTGTPIWHECPSADWTWISDAGALQMRRLDEAADARAEMRATQLRSPARLRSLTRLSGRTHADVELWGRAV